MKLYAIEMLNTKRQPYKIRQWYHPQYCPTRSDPLRALSFEPHDIDMAKKLLNRPCRIVEFELIEKTEDKP